MSLTFLRWLFIVPVAGGTIFGLLCVWTILRFRKRQGLAEARKPEVWPSVSILKPVHRFEKNLHENLRTTCLLDYPDYEVIFSVQRLDDPALSVLREIEREFGTSRAKIVVEEKNIGWNGKINNLAGALPHARHDVYVISDSDVRLPTGYLKAIVAPLSDQSVGFVCTPFRVAEADRWFEKLELLSLNADFMPSVIFAYETSASLFCLGASIALRRKTLDEIGGIEGLSDYLVEDYEMGRRIVERGYSSVLVLPVIETMVESEDALSMVEASGVLGPEYACGTTAGLRLHASHSGDSMRADLCVVESSRVNGLVGSCRCYSNEDGYRRTDHGRRA